jgi:hypothetical protein
VAINEPIRRVNTRTLASPGSENTRMMPSSPFAIPASGLNWFRRVCPIQIPAKSDRMTCLLQMASTIARTGGSTEYQVGSFIA